MTVYRSTRLNIAPIGAECHPSKVAVFSAEDIPMAKSPLYDLLAMKPAVDVNGVVMKMWVSPLVPKGSIYVIDRGKTSSEWPDEEKKS